MSSTFFEEDKMGTVYVAHIIVANLKWDKTLKKVGFLGQKEVLIWV